jgi:hypothetical protein
VCVITCVLLCLLRGVLGPKLVRYVRTRIGLSSEAESEAESESESLIRSVAEYVLFSGLKSFYILIEENVSFPNCQCSVSMLLTNVCTSTLLEERIHCVETVDIQ